MKKAQKLTALLLTALMVVSIIAPMTLTANAATALQWPVPGHFALSRGYSSSHGAMDINDSSIKGSDIVAAMGGTIVRISNCTVQHYGEDCSCGGTGTGVVVKGTDNRYYSYAHMIAGSIPSSFAVGTKVNAGDVLGRVGTTGNSSGPHLHFSIATGSNYLDNRIDPEYETYTNVGATAFTFSTLPGKMSVSNNDAVIAVSLSKPANNRLVSYGATVYDNNGVVLGTTSAASGGQKGVSTVSLWWTVSSSMGITLNPGRTYQFTFWANVSGVTLTSPKYSFTTTGTASTLYPFSYNANGGSGSIAGSSVYYGSNVSIADNAFTREGYDFAGYYHVQRSDGKWYVVGSTNGWFTESEITANGYTKKLYKPGESYTVSNAWTGGASTQFSFTFYAQWAKNAEEYDSLALGANYANISAEGEMKYFTFTPETTQTYLMYSIGEDDTYVEIYDADGNLIASDDDGGENLNFRLECTLDEGTSYTVAVYYVYYVDSPKTGTINFIFDELNYSQYDVNRDGNVDMFDYMAVKATYFNNNATEEEKAAADVNADGSVNMFDYMAIKSYYFTM